MRTAPSFRIAVALIVVVALTSATARPEDAAVRFVVNTVADTVDAAPGDGVAADADGRCSLRAAIQEANALGTRVTVILSGAREYPIGLSGSEEDASAQGDLDVHGAVIIEGNGALVLGDFEDRIFDVHAGASLALSDIWLVRSRVLGSSGGAIRSRGSLQVVRAHLGGVAFDGAEGEAGAGGCIFNDGGRLAAHGSIFGGDAMIGGAVAARGGETTLVNCRFEGGGAGAGGALHAAEDTDIALRGCVFVGNNANRGGAIFNGTGTMTLDRCRIVENHALGDGDGDGGGGVFNAGGTVLVTRTRIWDNDANGDLGDGGGILNVGGRVELTRSDVSLNFTSRRGGGIATVGGQVVAIRCGFDRNYAWFFGYAVLEPGSGGGVHVTGDADVTIDRCLFKRNYGYADGGALWSGGSGPVRVVRSRFVRNLGNYFAVVKSPDREPLHPVGHGGAIFHRGTSLEIERSRFDRNHTVGEAGTGGAIYNAGTGLSMTLSVVAGNAARSSGGGLDLDDGSETLLDQVSVVRNVSGGDEGTGGGIRLGGTSTLTMARGRLLRNRAASEGGGLWISESGTATLEGTRISGNRAPTGDQVFDEGGTPTGEAGE